MRNNLRSRNRKEVDKFLSEHKWSTTDELKLGIRRYMLQRLMMSQSVCYKRLEASLGIEPHAQRKLLCQALTEIDNEELKAGRPRIGAILRSRYRDKLKEQEEQKVREYWKWHAYEAWNEIQEDLLAIVYREEREWNRAFWEQLAAAVSNAKPDACVADPGKTT